MWTGIPPAHTARLSFLDGVIDEENYDRANYGDDKAVDIEAGNAMGPEETKQPPADNGADNSEDNVEDETFSRFVDDFASDEARNQTQHDPCQN
jgi:hypothetical protein